MSLRENADVITSVCYNKHMEETPQQPLHEEFERPPVQSTQQEAIPDSTIVSVVTPEDYNRQMLDIRKMMMSNSAAERDYSITAMSELQSEIPQFIMEVAGGMEIGKNKLEQGSDPEGTLVLLDKNIPSTAQIEARATQDTIIIKGMARRVYLYFDKSFGDLPIAMALTDKFVDDLYKYIEAKEKAA